MHSNNFFMSLYLSLSLSDCVPIYLTYSASSRFLFYLALQCCLLVSRHSKRLSFQSCLSAHTHTHTHTHTNPRPSQLQLHHILLKCASLRLASPRLTRIAAELFWDSELRKTFTGTLAYMSPERVRGDPYGSSVSESAT